MDGISRKINMTVYLVPICEIILEVFFGENDGVIVIQHVFVVYTMNPFIDILSE